MHFTHFHFAVSPSKTRRFAFRSRSVQVVSIPLQPLAADMSNIDNYEPHIPGYDFSPGSSPLDSPRLARTAAERMGLRDRPGKGSPRYEF
jgi:hypothetical protein